MKILIALIGSLSIVALSDAGYLRTYYASPPVVNVVHDYSPPVHYVPHVQPVVVAPRSLSYGWDHNYISQPASVVKIINVPVVPSYSYGGWWDKKK